MLRRHGMRPEEGRDQIHVMSGAQTVGRPQALQLVVDGQSVAALGLDGRGAVRQQAIQALASQVEQLILPCRPGGPHRREDAPTGVRDLLIRRAAQPHLKLLGAGPREDQVRVRIHKPRHDRPTACIDDLPARAGGDLVPHLDGRADGHDDSISSRHGAVRDDGQIAKSRPGPRPVVRPGQRQQLPGVHDQEIDLGLHNTRERGNAGTREQLIFSPTPGPLPQRKAIFFDRVPCRVPVFPRSRVPVIPLISLPESARDEMP